MNHFICIRDRPPVIVICGYCVDPYVHIALLYRWAMLVMCRIEEDSMLHMLGFAVLSSTFSSIEFVVNRRNT